MPIVVRQELWSALMLLPLFRADLRVSVDPCVMASDASLSGGAIRRSVGLTARGLQAARLAPKQQTSLCDDEVVLFYFLTTPSEQVDAPWTSFRWEWQLLFGLELTLLPSAFVATLGLTCQWSKETKRPGTVLCSQSVSVIRTLNG